MLNKTEMRTMEKETHNGLGHNPLNFGARHGCEIQWVLGLQKEVLVEETLKKP